MVPSLVLCFRVSSETQWEAQICAVSGCAQSAVERERVRYTHPRTHAHTPTRAHTHGGVLKSKTQMKKVQHSVLGSSQASVWVFGCLRRLWSLSGNQKYQCQKLQCSMWTAAAEEAAAAKNIEHKRLFK